MQARRRSDSIQRNNETLEPLKSWRYTPPNEIRLLIEGSLASFTVCLVYGRWDPYGDAKMRSQYTDSQPDDGRFKGTMKPLRRKNEMKRFKRNTKTFLNLSTYNAHPEEGFHLKIAFSRSFLTQHARVSNQKEAACKLNLQHQLRESILEFCEMFQHQIDIDNNCTKLQQQQQ